MTTMWKYEPEDFDPVPPRKAPRQFEGFVGNRGITNEHDFDQDGKFIQPEPKGHVWGPKNRGPNDL
jgi:hypothetical protein